jgi:prolyl oligopeptidase PreP (S9A serine peptidase family)
VARGIATRDRLGIEGGSNGGHGAAADNEQRALKWALMLEFLWERLAG